MATAVQLLRTLCMEEGTSRVILFTPEFLFIHNPKTAGTSLLQYFRKVLRRKFPWRVHIAGTPQLGTHHPHLSRALGYASAVTGTRPEDFKLILSVVRDPYDREVSMYAYFRKVLHGSHLAPGNLNNPFFEEIVAVAASRPFGAYLEWLDERIGTCDFWGSREYFREQDGSVPKNLRIAKFENLDTEIRDALSDAGLLGRNGPTMEVPRINATDRSGVSWDPRSLEIVTRSYAWMFDAGYYSRRSSERQTADVLDRAE